MTELRILNGQFVRDGQVVQPLFGDKEQIQALRKSVELRERIDKGHKKVSISMTKDDDEEWELTAKFKCSCGKNAHHDLLYSYMKRPTQQEMIEYFDNEIAYCWLCNTSTDVTEYDRVFRLKESEPLSAGSLKVEV